MTKEQLDAIRTRAAELGTCMTETTLLLAEVERLTAERDLARLNRDIEATAFREERTAHGTTRSRVQDAISVLWHRGRIELRLDDATTTTTALADALVGLFNEVERLTAERDALIQARERWLADCAKEMREAADDMIAIRKEHERAAFKRGVAAMREAAVLASRENVGCRHMVCHSCESPAAVIRAIPDPEDKP